MKKKYFLTLDTETATLPFANEIAKTPKEKQNIAIAKPLVYDIGWVISDRNGNIIKKENFLVQETFFVPSVFNTAYYKDKRPIYMEMLKNGEISVKCWDEIVEILLTDLRQCDLATAYNAAFDFKKAIPFTELYINKLYSPDFHDWLDYQNYLIDRAANGFRNQRTASSKPADENEIFRFRGGVYPLFDIWALACEHIMDSDEYRDFAFDEGLLTDSGKYYKTSAEVAYRFISRNREFVEAHTALDDAEIESEILASIIRKDKKKLKMGIVAFPFRIVGTVR